MATEHRISKKTRMSNHLKMSNNNNNCFTNNNHHDLNNNHHHNHNHSHNNNDNNNNNNNNNNNKWQDNLISYFKTMSDDLASAKLRSAYRAHHSIKLTGLNQIFFSSGNIVF